VIAELAITEKDFIRDMKITYETFNLHNPAHLEARGIDAVLLFGNILEVIIFCMKNCYKLNICLFL